MLQVALREYSKSYNLLLICIYLNNDHYMDRLLQFSTLWKDLVGASLKYQAFTLPYCYYPANKKRFKVSNKTLYRKVLT